jgi:hypothetical protein
MQSPEVSIPLQNRAAGSRNRLPYSLVCRTYSPFRSSASRRRRLEDGGEQWLKTVLGRTCRIGR